MKSCDAFFSSVGHTQPTPEIQLLNFCAGCNRVQEQTLQGLHQPNGILPECMECFNTGVYRVRYPGESGNLLKKFPSTAFHQAVAVPVRKIVLKEIRGY